MFNKWLRVNTKPNLFVYYYWKIVQYLLPACHYSAPQENKTKLGAVIQRQGGGNICLFSVSLLLLSASHWALGEVCHHAPLPVVLVVCSLLNHTSNNSQLPAPLEKLRGKPDPMSHGMELLWGFVVLVRAINSIGHIRWAQVPLKTFRKYNNCPSSGHGTQIRPNHSLSKLSHLIEKNLRYDLIQGQWCMFGLSVVPSLSLALGDPMHSKTKRSNNEVNEWREFKWPPVFGVFPLEWFR